MEQKVYQNFAQVEQQHWWFKGRRDYIRSILESFCPANSGTKICEVGAGTGGTLSLLAEFGKVDAIEMNEAARKIIKAKKIVGVESVLHGKLPDDMPTCAGYHALLALDVLEHVEDDLGALIQIHNMLASDGVLVVTVPAYLWLWSDHDEVNHHCRRYIRPQLVNTIESSGFRVKYTSYFNSILFPIAAIQRLWSNAIRYIFARKESSTIEIPSSMVNSILYRLFKFESFLASRFSVPFGLSIVVVAEKNVKK